MGIRIVANLYTLDVHYEQLTVCEIQVSLYLTLESCHLSHIFPPL